MILLVFLSVGLVFFAFCYLQESGAFRATRKLNAEIIDEVEDEIFDNTGGTTTRFFKAYEFTENGEKKVVRSGRPMKRITGNVGKRCTIAVDSKNRKAMEMSDVIRYRIYALILVLAALLIDVFVIYMLINVPGAVLI